ncbi:hypothetical protein [Orgyia leucostigma nucleopolyhedrovirus]|uniref:Chitin-binding type-2 domain-containing protein n=1 Tax=Orgyia leucostigma nucleopolyhedrovirus TaxID=490711 RepID=B0FDP4_9ABAC|nr:hypothetical protein [Orgyia leucostigma nucleopolyhedrovirus]ABY65752.1 hypothetical protein [Orgyia leucostigma nucleopolyhedrovirus]
MANAVGNRFMFKRFAYIAILLFVLLVVGFIVFRVKVIVEEDYRYLKHPFYPNVMYDRLTDSIKLCPDQCQYFHENLQACKSTGHQLFNPECLGRIGNIKHLYDCNKFYICLKTMSMMASCIENSVYDYKTDTCINGTCNKNFCENCCVDDDTTNSNV